MGERDENLRKKSRLIGSERRGQTTLEAAVISRDAKETSQSDVRYVARYVAVVSRNSRNRERGSARILVNLSALVFSIWV